MRTGALVGRSTPPLGSSVTATPSPATSAARAFDDMEATANYSQKIGDEARAAYLFNVP